MPPKNFGGTADLRKYSPQKIRVAIRVLAMPPKNIYSSLNFASFAMPPKDLALFLIYTPRKTLF